MPKGEMNPRLEQEIIDDGFAEQLTSSTESEQPSIQEAVDNVARDLRLAERTTGLISPTLTEAIKADVNDRRINI